VEELKKLQEKAGVSPAALELTEAATKRSEPEVKAALESYQKAIASSTDPLAPYLGSLEGGNPAKGGQLFESHPAAQCMRCHSGGHGGGEAGPDLSGVGKRGDRRYLLESLINPGAKVVAGYGIGSITLKGGKNVAGIELEQTDDHVDFDSNGKVLRVMRSDIESMIDPVSPMPPMGALLNGHEIRDLVAWLATRDQKGPEPKKRPAPEVVKP
jgi:quinoprotein glucose dehydrogenase